MTKFSIKNKIKRAVIDIPRSFFLFGFGPFFRKFKKKPLPQKDKILIHIGCGDLNDKRYINVDSRPGWHIDYVDAIENINKRFPENHADLIYACHVLEHVSHLKLVETLKRLRMCLKPGGVLRLSVPNFETIISMYNEQKNINDIVAPLMGGQGYVGNYHASTFDSEHLKKLLLKSGFKEVRKWEPNNVHSFDDWSRRTINLYGREWVISLNLEAIK